MPNRILKDSIVLARHFALSWFEVFFYRLVVTVDDYGCYFASPAILRGKMFREIQLPTLKLKAMNTLSSLGIIRTTVEDESYLEIVTWDKHQTRRAKHRKYPSYEESDEYRALQSNPHEITCKQVKTNESGKIDYEQKDEKCSLSNVKSSEITCNHMKSHVPEESRNRGIEESRNRGVEKYCPERSDDLSEPEPNVFIELPLNDKTFHAVTEEDVSKYRELYPAVNVEQELRNMYGWLDSNPKRLKTRGGIRRFITNWLSKEQNGGGNYRAGKPKQRNLHGITTRA